MLKQREQTLVMAMDDKTREWFSYYNGKEIILPDKFMPGKQFIEYHNDVIFKGA